jgi:hypothetical protein
LGCLFAVLSALNWHNDILRNLAIFFVLFALQQIIKRQFTYWECDSAGIRERRLWRVKEIPWQAITHIGSFTHGGSSPGYVTIGCDYRAPMSVQGHIAANPEDRAQFLATLRAFATQAKFDV